MHRSFIPPTDQQITDMADDLEVGYRVFWNFKIGKSLVVPAEDAMDYIDTELIQDDLDELKKNRKNYVEVEKINSRESFMCMEDFIETAEIPEGWRKRLLFAVGQKKPFAHFKNTVDDSPVREEWFAFRKQRYIDWVRRTLSQGT